MCTSIRCRIVLSFVVFCLIGCELAIAQNDAPKQKGYPYPPKFEGASAVTYKKTGDTELAINIFNPPDHKANDKRPAIIFFFGGGWKGGNPGQFEHQCRYLASRGMIAMTADYRVASRHKTLAVDCVRDAKSAIRWVRANSATLGVDPNRIVAGGGSAGGHIAACTGTLEGQDEPSEDRNVSSRPNAMVLFNPVMALGSYPEAPTTAPTPDATAESLASRLGVKPDELSPAHHVRAGLPPTIQFFGTDDKLKEGALYFEKRMKAEENRCETKLYEGQAHGFFNYGRGGSKYFLETLTAADQFLVSLGYLTGEPSVEKYLAGVKEMASR